MGFKFSGIPIPPRSRPASDDLASRLALLRSAVAQPSETPAYSGDEKYSGSQGYQCTERRPLEPRPFKGPFQGPLRAGRAFLSIGPLHAR